MDISKAKSHVDAAWADSILPQLIEYVRIPNKSPLFDPDWEAHGHMEAAVQLMLRWAQAEAPAGSRIEVLRLQGRTPVLMVDVPGDVDDCVLMYGHLDKQPEFTGWSEGLDPWTPVIRDGKLYGRGGADDGYALFSSIAAIRALREQKIPHARCVVLIEASEESGSPDLPAHIDALGARLGMPSLVVCLDAECGNYDQLWCTTSLRGNLIGTLRADVLTEGVHSGMASGIVPSSMRVLRELLARVEDVHSGAILVDELNTPIPADRRTQAEAAARVLGPIVAGRIPFVPGMKAMSNDPLELLLNSTWRPTLSVTGAEGIPPFRSAGNVLRPYTSLKLSFRLTPTMDPKVAVGGAQARTRTGSAVRRQGQLHRRIGDGWLERAFVRAVARGIHAARVTRVLRQGLDVHGHRRQHSVHGHARREIPRHAVPDHGRARPELERTRAERVPASRHGAESDGLRGAGAGGPRAGSGTTKPGGMNTTAPRPGGAALHERRPA